MFVARCRLEVFQSAFQIVSNIAHFKSQSMKIKQNMVVRQLHDLIAKYNLITLPRIINDKCVLCSCFIFTFMMLELNASSSNITWACYFIIIFAARTIIPKSTSIALQLCFAAKETPLICILMRGWTPFRCNMKNYILR